MAVGERRYHDKHPFHRRLVAGELSEPQVRSWVENRYYYQKQIPVKDAAVLANLPSASHRRAWISRIYDHDGTDDGSDGGTASWLALARAVGLSDEDVLSERNVAPGNALCGGCLRQLRASASVDRSRGVVAHRTFRAARHAAACRRDSRQVSVDRSFGARVLRTANSLGATRRRLGAELGAEAATTRELQDRCVAALEFKCDVLWCILDATALACGVFHE